MIITLNPSDGPEKNTSVLQQYLDRGGTIRLEEPGTYDLNGPLFIGDDTALEFGPGVIIRRMPGGADHPFIVNRGVTEKKQNRNIRVEGLHLVTNNVDLRPHLSLYPALRGHLAFLGVRDLIIRDYQCLDLTRIGYGIHICSFENILLERLYIAGDKDGVHLSDGRFFTIRDSRFATYDDAIALNAYDYCLSTAVYGTLEDGLIENCHDFAAGKAAGLFCRMLGGAWQDWHPGMLVRNSTLAVCNNKLYSVCLPLPPKVKDLVSNTPPVHDEGIREYDDGISWRYVKEHDGIYEATCRRITLRNIYLHKERIGVGFTLTGDLWADSVPAGLPLPVIEDLVLDGIHAECELECLIGGQQPVKNIRVCNSTVRGTAVWTAVYEAHSAEEYPEMDIVFCGVDFQQPLEKFSRLAPGRKVNMRFYGCSGNYPAE